MRVVRYRASSGPIRDAPEEVACRWVGLLETCGVVDRNFGGVPARHPDRLIKWFIEVVLLGVGVNLLSSYVVPQDWAWLPPARFVAALLVAVPSAGLLDRWPLVGSHLCCSGSPPCRVVSRPCWTMDLGGVALLLGPVTALLLGVAFLLDRWALTPIPAVRSRGPRRDWVHGVAADRRTCLRGRRPSRRVREDRRFGQLAVSGQRQPR